MPETSASSPAPLPRRPWSRAARARRAAWALLPVLAAACGGGGAAPAPTPTPQGAAGQPAQPAQAWPIKTREHVDLWLHGYALLLDDTARVPLFRRGYRDEVVVEKNRRRITTALDTNRARLRARFVATPALALNPQFVPLYFDSGTELRQAIDAFVQSGGDPRRAGDQRTAAMVAFLAGNFPTAPDREWLRAFYQSLVDESQRFHHAWWVEAQRARAAALAAADSAWTGAWRARLQPFLGGTQQRDGELLLSLPLDGEGRTVALGERQNVVTIGFPARPQDAPEVLYGFAHEVVGAVAGSIVRDNTTPAEQRTGVADRMTSAAQVRGGLLLLQRVAPEQAAGYARYYLRAANLPASGDPAAALVAAFPLPPNVAAALTRQIEVVMGGI